MAPRLDPAAIPPYLPAIARFSESMKKRLKSRVQTNKKSKRVLTRDIFVVENVTYKFILFFGLIVRVYILHIGTRFPRKRFIGFKMVIFTKNIY